MLKSYAERFPGQGAELVVVAISQIDGPALVGVAHGDRVHHDADSFVQVRRADIGEGERKAERSGFDHGPGDVGLLGTEILRKTLKLLIKSKFSNRNVHLLENGSSSRNSLGRVDQHVDERSHLLAGFEPGAGRKLLPHGLTGVGHEQKTKSGHSDLGALTDIAGQTVQNWVDL